MEYLRILHICNDYSQSKVYKHLYNELDKLGCCQVVFHPLRNAKNIGLNSFEFKTGDSKLIYSRLLKNYHRILFRSKIKSLYKSLLQQIKPEDIDLSNATTLFSDGAIAYKLWRNYKIPYTVTVRHTDVNLFLKYRPDLIPLGIEILRNSSKIIFISPSFKSLLFTHRKFAHCAGELKDKIEIIPNGIDDFWLKNRRLKNGIDTNKFLFVGRFDKHKNGINLIKALKELKPEYPDIELSLVGGGGNREKEIKKLIAENTSWIHFYGKIFDKKELLKIYGSHKYYAMVSIYETFGLVYLEALSQGLPVIYTKEQGIDNLFDFCIGKSATPGDIEDIKNNIRFLIDNPTVLELEKIDFSRFSWQHIAQKYQTLFEQLVE